MKKRVTTLFSVLYLCPYGTLLFGPESYMADGHMTPYEDQNCPREVNTHC